MHCNSAQALLPAGKGFRQDVPPHALPTRCIDAEGDQAAQNEHNNPGRRQAHRRAEGTKSGNPCHNQTGPQGACGALTLLCHQRLLRVVAAPRPPLDLPPRVGIGAITSWFSKWSS